MAPWHHANFRSLWSAAEAEVPEDDEDNEVEEEDQGAVVKSKEEEPVEKEPESSTHSIPYPGSAFLERDDPGTKTFQDAGIKV